MSIGFVEARYGTSLFIYSRDYNKAYLLLHVDDIHLTTSSMLLHHIINALQHEFMMKDLGELSHFLGIFVQCQV